MMRRRPEENRRDNRTRSDRAHENGAGFPAADVHEQNSDDRAEY